MTIRDEEILIEKLKFYKAKGEAVHLVLENSRGPHSTVFRNGITEEIKKGSIIFEDEKLGAILIYISELIDVQKREAKR